MDIRIGNDIRIDVTLQNLGISSVADIDSVKCVLLKECTHKDARSNKPFCYPSKYTIGCCGAPVYNVYPYNITAQYFHTAPNCFMASCLHCNNGCCEIEIEASVSEQDSKIRMCYPAAQLECGEYALVLSVTVKEKDWRTDGKHTCSFGYGKLFRIVKEEFGKCGTIMINLPKCNNYDIDAIAVGKFETDKCTITAIPDYEERGYTTGSGQYRYGQAVRLTAVAFGTYTFACWDDGERAAARIVTANGDAKYTALFSDGVEYDLYFYDEDRSTILDHQMLTYGSKIVPPTVQDREGKQFIGWNEPIANYMPEQTLIYYAVYYTREVKTITVSANNDNYGTVTPTATKVVGAYFTMIATPNQHYYFSHWEKDGNIVSTSSVYTIEVTEDEAYTAVFVPNTYTIRVSTTGDGYVNIDGIRSLAKNFEYAPNVTSELTAVGEGSYSFSRWSDGNTDNPRTIQVTSNASYTAEFVIQRHTVTVQSNDPQKGYVTVKKQGSTPSQNVTVDYGDTVTLQAVVLQGYDFKGWLANGVSEGNYDLLRENIIVLQDVVYTAQFGSHDKVTVTASLKDPESNAGTITGSGFTWNSSTNTGSGEYDENTRITLTANANVGHNFNSWEYSGEISNVVINDNTIAFTLPSIDGNLVSVSVTAVFSGQTYSVTVAPNIEVCTITPSRLDIVGYGGSTWFEVSNISPHYTFVGWLLSGEIVSTETRLLVTNVTEDLTYRAIFENDKIRISVRAEDVSHNVTGVSLATIESYGNNCLVDQGTRITIKATTTNNQWEFVKWMYYNPVSETYSEVDSSWGTSDTHQMNVDYADEGGYAAIYRLKKYYISVPDSGIIGGSASPNGSQNYEYGTLVLITPSANNGYAFDYWLKNGIRIVSGQDGYTVNNNVLSFNIDQDKGGSTAQNAVVYAPVFVQNANSVSVQKNIPAGGEVTGGGNYSYGTQVTLTATASTGYTFVNWTKGGTEVSQNANYQFEMDENTGGTYIANFSVNKYQLVATASPSNGGSVSPSLGQYDYNSSVTLIATPNTGYHFVKWSDEITGSSRLVTIKTTGNSYTAIFEQDAPMYYYGTSNIDNIDDFADPSSISSNSVIALNSTSHINTSITNPFNIQGVLDDVFYIMYEKGTLCTVNVMQNGYPVTPDWQETALSLSENYVLKYFEAAGSFTISNINYNTNYE